ncbi:MAG TPA: siderophore ABC transporter substrate-binding protein [Tepidiformaceae bacterium]|nr:siderophore ABC transporter substrate-binding protein [Tepidiformaceae bacterium]
MNRVIRRRGAWLLSAIAVFSLLVLAACGSSDDDEKASPTSGTAATAAASPTDSGPTEVTVTHFAGTDTVPVKPDTVVVFDLGVFLSLNALGVEVDALGGLSTPIPDEFKAAVTDKKLKPVGTAFEPDYEAVNALEPDLIIVAGRSSATFPEMKKIAPTIDLTIDSKNYMASFRQRHEVLGQIFGVQEKVAAELEKLDKEVAAVKAKAPNAGSALVVMTNGAEVSAYGPGSRFGLVHDLLGYKAADESLERDATHGDVISFEFILKAQPAVMFVVDRASTIGQNGDAAKKVLDNKLVKETPAWKNGRVVYTDGFAWYIVSNSLPGMLQIVEDAKSGLGSGQ